MSKALLKYQVEHLRTRIWQVAQQKKSKIMSECEKAVAKLPKPGYFTPYDAICDIHSDIEPPSPAKFKRSLKSFVSYGTFGCEQQNGQFNVMKYTGMDKLNKRREAAYEKRCKTVRKRFFKRSDKVGKRADKVFDSVILAGAEGFDDVLNKFKKEDF